jgi:hypothetical protein
VELTDWKIKIADVENPLDVILDPTCRRKIREF